MEKRGLVDRCLLVKPTIWAIAAFASIVVVGILGEALSWQRIPGAPYSNIAGGAVFVAGWFFHRRCHTFHRRGHDRSGDIETLVTNGVFGSIRHPMYASLMLMFLGVAVAWGVAWMLLPAVAFSLFAVAVAVTEETFLLEKLGPQYGDYMRQTPWRFVPHLF